ncbi:MAG: proton-conducting transporter membrane subunit [Syntrophales bacterium]|nr:proton-conducting transporter membrane subunit [Syntrophales bacterium]
MATLGLIAIIYTAMIAYAQEDMKQMIAYSSISHMGVITLGQAHAAADTVDNTSTTFKIGQSPTAAAAVTGALSCDSDSWADETTAANSAAANDMNLTPVQTVDKAWSYNADTPSWTDDTTVINDANANDVNLVPLQATTAGDTYYFGFSGKSTEIRLNIGTAGVYSDITLAWGYSQGSGSWNTLAVTDSTSGFTVSGTNSITYSAPGDWATDTVNGTANLYWVRVVCSFGGSPAITTSPLGTQGWYPPNVGDAYYFGWATEMPIKYDVNVGTAGTGTWTVTWEYYNGSWTALSGLVDNTVGFTAVGTNSVYWTKPTDATKTTLLSIEAFWVRARISSYTSMGVQALGTQAWVYDQYEIWRGGVFFDTSALPDTAVITSATLSLNVSADNTTDDFSVTVVSGYDLDDPLVAVDYGELLSQTVSLGATSTSGASVGSYLDITLNTLALSHINVIGTTKFAIRSSKDISATAPTNDEYITFKTYEEGVDKPQLSVTYTATGGGTITVYPYGTYDGYMHVNDATYNTAQSATSGDVYDTAITSIVGQNYAASTYDIWRSVLYFDLTNVPTDATVTSATVSLYGYSDNSTTDFNITVVAGDAAETPLSSLDYDDLGNESFGTLNSANWSVGQYNNILLNGDGRENIICGGITQLGLRSEEDINASAPTDGEYVTFYTSESPNKPILYVTYTVPGLGLPDLFEIVSVRVFDNFIIDGDSLVVLEYKCYYTSIPSQNPIDYYYVQLLEGTSVVGQTRMPNWGHAVASLYFQSGLDPVVSRSILFAGDSGKFSTPPEQSYTIQSSDYAGGNPETLKIWVRWEAIGMSGYYGTDLVVYIEGVICLNELGQAIFGVGIPGLEERHPDLFQVAGQPLEPDEDQTYTAYEPETSLGSYISSRLEMAGGVFGLSGNMFGGFLLVVVMAACMASMYKYTGNVTGGAIVSVPIVVLCGILGIVPLALIAIAGLMCVALLFHGLWLSRT